MAKASFDLAAGVPTLIYQTPAGKKAAVDVTLTPRTQGAVISVWHTPSGAPVDADLIVSGRVLAVLAIATMNLALGAAGERIYAQADVTGVSCGASPIEEDV